MKIQSFFKKSLILLVIIGNNILGFAQVDSTSLIEISGKIIDSKTNDALVFADLVVSDSNIATISNTEGDYLLKIPADFKNGFITITYLGYAEKKIQISDVIANSTIMLDQFATSLEEVNITRPKSAEILVRMMLKRNDDNYMGSNMQMTGFYRETIKKRRQNASLAEAVVSIYKQPNSNTKRDEIDIVKVRKNTNYAKLDTIALKLQGGPFSNLYADIMKYPQYIFSEDNLDNYVYSFDKSTVINDQLVYVVNFKQYPELQMPLYFGKLYIDAKTYALTSAVYSLNVENRELASELFVKRKPRRAKVYPVEANYRVNYRNSNGKWLYSYSNILLTFKVNWQGKLFNSVYTLNSEMAITNWNATDERYSRPDNKLRVLKPTSILLDEASGFSDSEFWGEYNIIEPEKSIESAIQKIQKQLDKS
ncbi:carboxypeptidase-like regulatory domain-containing protein [Bizionia myxarmorum]|uniref:Carboxypeptidase-like regulatory domain-containing protein n=1 Tax=Bizionia myxarmorum TaxID=291186 RepID=A0A5D0R7P7_9FLAO|nr:carboxypeptidase-like regulatory domain-containing protein [Bizionia myxarmorum]TYB76955.1 carboxypeptidase-like regulatory domain-containing protein [Bizionia myxarmorum]